MATVKDSAVRGAIAAPQQEGRGRNADGEHAHRRSAAEERRHALRDAPAAIARTVRLGGLDLYA